MQRGEIRLVEFEAVRGSEADKIRPAVIVSNNAANGAVERLRRGVVTVVPLTSNATRVLPFQIFVPAVASGLRIDSKAQAEQVRAVAVERVGRVVGALPAEFVTKLDHALRVHLAL